MDGSLKLYDDGYALVIGVGADLPVTIDDAEAIHECLVDKTVCAYPENQVKLLTSEEANQTNILGMLDWLIEVTSEDSSTIIYFSGHGINNPEYYLLPNGYNLMNLEETAIESNLFSEKLSKIRSKKLLVVLDCCHAGGQAQLKDGGSYAIPAKVLDELAEHSGRVIIASSYQDEKSYTGKPLSVFTQAFLEGLAGCGAPVKDGYSRVLDIYTWAARMVPNRTNDKQHPMIKVRDMGDNFPVAWYAGGGKTPHGSQGNNSDPSDDKSRDEICAKNKILSNYKKNLLLIETRMSEYIAFTDIPLQLISSKQVIESRIKELKG